MNDDKISLIYDILKDYIKDSSDRMGRIELDLKTHIEGVMQNRTRIEKLEEKENTLENKVERLEEPGKALKLIKTWSLWVVVVSSAITLICKSLGVI